MSVSSILSETYLGSSVPQYFLFFAAVGLGAVVGRSLSYLYQRRLIRIIVTVHRWIAETGGRSTGNDLQ
jgi:Mn2+/Fe2+ NRAMP family transporter